MIRLAKPIVTEHLVHVAADAVTLGGNLRLPEDARAVVLFAHGSGSGRHSYRNRYVAQLLNEAKLATLLIDLLTANEEAIDLHTAHLRFDIDLLARRLIGATDWLTQRADTRHLPIGCHNWAGRSVLATHLFEEPGALDEVARLARVWFERHLLPTTRHAAEASR
jgi:hypothetical protein